jgi:hypothetical protein
MTSIAKSFTTTAVGTNVWRVVLLSVLAAFILSSVWSARFVDQDIGDNIANSLLGYDAKATPITGALAGAFFAFVTGLAGTFTACNICAFSAIAPLAAGKRTVGKVLRPMLYLSVGIIAVAAIYGAIGALIGPSLPQLSEARLGDPETGIQVRSVNAMVVFVSIGSIFVLWGLMVLNIIRNPFANLAMRYPWANSLFMGALIGAFLIGRPFALFRKMFEYAAETHNPFFGSLAFVLQGLGNVVIMVAIFLILMYGTGGRFERWLTARPGRPQTVTAAALITAGVFFIIYWGPRWLARNGFFWWPYINWG